MDSSLLLIGTVIVGLCVGTIFGDTYGWLFLGIVIIISALIPEKWWKS